VTGDGHQVTLGCHNITKQGQVTIVDIGAIKRYDMVHLSLNGLADSLNTQGIKHLNDVISICPDRVHISFTQNLCQAGAISLKYPLTDSFKLSLLCYVDPSLVICCWQVHVHLGNCLNALKAHVRQKVGLNAPQEHIVFHLVHNLLIVLKLVVIRVHDTYSQHQFLCIVIVKDAVKIISKASLNLFRNLLHGQFLVCHTLSVQLDAEEPRRYAGGIKIWHFIVDAYPLLILCYYCIHGVRVVVDSSVCCNSPQCGVLQAT
jgi:hypothetical protein